MPDNDVALRVFLPRWVIASLTRGKPRGGTPSAVGRTMSAPGDGMTDRPPLFCNIRSARSPHRLCR